MALLVVMYKAPHDAAAFDKHYFEKHIPLAKKIPRLRKYEVSSDGRRTVQLSPSPTASELVTSILS